MKPPIDSEPSHAPAELLRVYVWDWPVRITHWMIFLSMAVLAVTGLYIGKPFAINGAESVFTMGWIKVIHFYAAIVFTLSVLTRFVWFFVGSPHARWDHFLPVKKERRKGLVEVLKFYLFFLRRPPSYVGHNPLAGLTYTLVFLLYFVMIVTGSALYGMSAPVGSPMRWFGSWVPYLGGAQTLRWVHHGTMWLLIAFFVHHLYSAALTSAIEGNATVDSIFSGYKFISPEELARAKKAGTDVQVTRIS